MGFDLNIASGTTDLGYGAMESIAMHWCHMYSLNPINTISVALHLLKHAISEHIKKTQWTKVKKCNLCENAFSYTGALRTHLKTHSGYKSNKCNQCDFDLLKQAISEHIEKHTMDKSQTNVINVKMYLLKQAN